MGLFDVLNGMQNGPRGQRTPGTASGGVDQLTPDGRLPTEQEAARLV
jgi:hypothetical protein